MNAIRTRWEGMNVDDKRTAFVLACVGFIAHLIAVALFVLATPNMLLALLFWDILIGSFAGLTVVAKRLFPGERR